MESKGCKLRVIASGLCMATVVLVSILTDEIQVTGEHTRLAEFSNQQNYELSPVTQRDLNDPVPMK